MGLGGMAVARGHMDLWPLVLIGTAGTTVGNYFWYWVGRRFGYRGLKPFIDRQEQPTRAGLVCPDVRGKASNHTIESRKAEFEGLAEAIRLDVAFSEVVRVRGNGGGLRGVGHGIQGSGGVQAGRRGGAAWSRTGCPCRESSEASTLDITGRASASSVQPDPRLRAGVSCVCVQGVQT